MNKMGRIPIRDSLVHAGLIAVYALMFQGHSRCQALDLEGYTEPFRTIHVAADEVGIIQEMLVREGDSVNEGQGLSRLNSDVHRALLAIAEQNMRSTGRLDAAKAELQLRQDRLEKLRLLRSEGHARQEEVDRSRTEVAVAEANVRAATDDIHTRTLEYEKIRVQLQRRTVRAPVTGVVTALLKQPGEYVAPNNPDVLTLVQLDPLLATFTVMSPDCEKLRVGQSLDVVFISSGITTTGLVDFVAPVTDAESGTVQIKLRIANGDSRFRSGERCKVRLATD